MTSRHAANFLLQPVDAAWLAFYRITFGVLMTWQAFRCLSQGWVSKNWIGHDFHFKYPLFSWVEAWPGDGMIAHFWVLAILGLFVAAGFLYRLSTTLLFLGHAHVFLIEKACYQNHSYLICLLALLTIFLPAHRCASVDAWLRPRIRSRTVPAWSLWLVRFQVGIPYFFGGVAKLNPDWLRGEPLREWLARRTEFPIFGPHFGEDWAIYLFSYGGLLIDLVAVPLLLWRRTRLLAFAALFLFHCSNAALFTIGVFPWMMIVLTVVFLDPDTPRRLAGCLWPSPTRRAAVVAAACVACAAVAVWFLGRVELPAILAGAAAGAFLAGGIVTRPAGESDHGVPVAARSGPVAASRRLLTGALLLWVCIQVLVPLRHMAIPRRVAWTTEGERFSWHMKLNDRDGRVMFYVHVPGRPKPVAIDPRARLDWWQVNRMDGRPYMIRQFARYLAQQYEAREGQPVEVRVRAVLSLNDRPQQLLIDPDIDIARAPVPWFGSARWILDPQPTRPGQPTQPTPSTQPTQGTPR